MMINGLSHLHSVGRSLLGECCSIQNPMIVIVFYDEVEGEVTYPLPVDDEAQGIDDDGVAGYGQVFGRNEFTGEVDYSDYLAPEQFTSDIYELDKIMKYTRESASIKSTSLNLIKPTHKTGGGVYDYHPIYTGQAKEYELGNVSSINVKEYSLYDFVFAVEKDLYNSRLIGMLKYVIENAFISDVSQYINKKIKKELDIVLCVDTSPSMFVGHVIDALNPYDSLNTGESWLDYNNSYDDMIDYLENGIFDIYNPSNLRYFLSGLGVEKVNVFHDKESSLTINGESQFAFSDERVIMPFVKIFKSKLGIS